MVVQFVGVRKYDFTASDGKVVKGQKLHYIYRPDNVDGVQGSLTDTIFISDGSAVKLPVIDFNKRYKLVYEFNGKRPVLSEISQVTIS